MADDAGTVLPAARVLSLIDASRHSLAALGAAVDLASRRRLDLVGLFIEERELLECAAFSFAREVGAQSGLSRPFSTPRLKASLDRHARSAARALTEAVAGRDLRHCLQVSRGGVVSETLAVVGPEDVLVLGKAGLSGHWGVRLGSSSRALMLEAPCSVILWDARWPVRSGPLYCLGQPPLAPDVLIQRFRGLVDSVEPLPDMGAEELVRYLARHRGGALMLQRAALAALSREDPELLARLPVAVFVVP